MFLRRRRGSKERGRDGTSSDKDRLVDRSASQSGGRLRWARRLVTLTRHPCISSLPPTRHRRRPAQARAAAAAAAAQPLTPPAVQVVVREQVNPPVQQGDDDSPASCHSSVESKSSTINAQRDLPLDYTPSVSPIATDNVELDGEPEPTPKNADFDCGQTPQVVSSHAVVAVKAKKPPVSPVRSAAVQPEKIRLPKSESSRSNNTTPTSHRTEALPVAVPPRVSESPTRVLRTYQRMTPEDAKWLADWCNNQLPIFVANLPMPIPMAPDAGTPARVTAGVEYLLGNERTPTVSTTVAMEDETGRSTIRSPLRGQGEGGKQCVSCIMQMLTCQRDCMCVDTELEWGIRQLRNGQIHINPGRPVARPRT
ncbi:unnamed protein product [Vitrella brassicaformis CCMP3155]|uniref:Uncharacterized protein n=1 Tax=Vitrella brassicaformis (strain CCMP3155) TaxID=1169540 RepID=A0A0G4FST5_VITBC|nr:unnamed protein product [Vitrella brassicaformis CCMP3155]|eukprot:CEM17357.1 unnamed protein product [Vitrella brassicaformis CCMP3155]